MTVFALGKFDALHRGHRALVAAAAELGRPGLVSFTGMAEILGWPARAPLLDDAGRTLALDRWSQDVGAPVADLRLPFAAVRELTPAAFVDLLVHEHGASGLVSGADFRFGHDRAGDVAVLAAECQGHGIGHSTVPAVRDDGGVISSTRVRQALLAGNVGQAADLLGRDHLISGVIGRGDGRGRQLGFPTANLTGIAVVVPAVGVYAARARLAGGAWIQAAVNVGHLPTLGEQRPLSVEAHLLDWQGDCYGAVMQVAFGQRLRGEQQFADLDALMAQIERDVEAVRAALQ